MFAHLVDSAKPDILDASGRLLDFTAQGSVTKAKAYCQVLKIHDISTLLLTTYDNSKIPNDSIHRVV